MKGFVLPTKTINNKDVAISEFEDTYKSSDSLYISTEEEIKIKKLLKQLKKVVCINLIERKDWFQCNVQLGFKCLQKSRSEENKESRIYLAKMFNDGEIVPSDIEEAKKCILEIDSREKDTDCLFLIGKLKKKKHKSFKWFLKSHLNLVMLNRCFIVVNF